MTITVTIETPLQDEIRVLIAQLNATLLELTPPEFVFHMTAEQMAASDTTVFIAREDGQAVACGALKRHAGGIGEVKRMYTRPSHRGRKIGAMIVEQIEVLARGKGLTRLVLETGDRHPAAWTVYERAGFTRCGPVLDYPDSKWSVFYDKSLIPSSRPTFWPRLPLWRPLSSETPAFPPRSNPPVESPAHPAVAARPGV